MSKSKQRAVIVTTEFRGVFFGFMDGEVKDSSVVLKQAQNCVYWSSDVRGFMGLAANGPTKSCKVGPAVPSITLNKVTAVVEVTPEAAEKWMRAPWNG